MPEIFSRQMIIGKKKNLAIEASMKPLKRSKVRRLLLLTASFETEDNILMMEKKERLAGKLKYN